MGDPGRRFFRHPKAEEHVSLHPLHSHRSTISFSKLARVKASRNHTRQCPYQHRKSVPKAATATVIVTTTKSGTRNRISLRLAMRLHCRIKIGAISVPLIKRVESIEYITCVTCSAPVQAQARNRQMGKDSAVQTFYGLSSSSGPQ